MLLCWSIGREILDRQRALGWGDGVVGRISQDLRTDTGGARGILAPKPLLRAALCRAVAGSGEVQPLAAQLGWTIIRCCSTRSRTTRNATNGTPPRSSSNGGHGVISKAQIDLRLHERTGASVASFPAVLEAVDAQRALEATKDPYVFDFLDLGESAHERELEQALIDDIQRFLFELSEGFAFYGRQKALQVGGREFFLDLLFYHHALRRFVVIDLKIGAFEPEHVSKINLYLNAVDEQLRRGHDQESVGIILCTSRDETVAKLALHRVYAPIAVSTWRTDTPPALSPVDVTDGVPVDFGELAQMDDVRSRLVERVARRAAEESKSSRVGQADRWGGFQMLSARTASSTSR